MIKEICLITESDGEKFHDLVIATAGQYQTHGLTVEIQYQPIGTSYSALIIGRE
jgi:hypothetical protein